MAKQTKQKNTNGFDKNAINSNAYAIFINELNELDGRKKYKIDEIKLLITESFSEAVKKHLNIDSNNGNGNKK